MAKKKVIAAYFSPTGGTRQAALCVAQGLGTDIYELDLSLPQAQSYDFTKDDLVVLAGPSFAGRIPAVMSERLARLCAHETPAVTVIAYGNRAYEDALIELNDRARQQGFVLAGSVCAVTEHSISRAVAAGRPNKEDCNQLAAYAQQILNKLEGGEPAPLSVPGNHPYKDVKPIPAVPVVWKDACSSCGLCAEKCPVQAISKDNPASTNIQKCISCMRCIRVCPSNARHLPEQIQGMLDQKLAPLVHIKKENELFL